VHIQSVPSRVYVITVADDTINCAVRSTLLYAVTSSTRICMSPNLYYAPCNHSHIRSTRQVGHQHQNLQRIRTFAVIAYICTYVRTNIHHLWSGLLCSLGVMVDLGIPRFVLVLLSTYLHKHNSIHMELCWWTGVGGRDMSCNVPLQRHQNPSLMLVVDKRPAHKGSAWMFREHTTSCLGIIQGVLP
jgi:hypothetical protein